MTLAKKKKAPSVLAAKRKAWQALSRYVRKRDKRCCTCIRGRPEQAGHYIHNGDKENKNLGGNALWYDERNINGQCAACNNKQWGNGRPREYAIFLEAKYGHGILQELRQLWRTPRKWTLEEVNEITKKYEKLEKSL